MAILITSNGIFTMSSPLSENITNMVKSNAYRVSGLIAGMNFLLYQSFPLALTKKYLVRNPAIKGIPR